MISFSEGGAYERGLRHGIAAQRAVRFNVEIFWDTVGKIGASRQLLLNRLMKKFCEEAMNEEHYEYLKGIADGAALRREDILVLNMLRHFVSPDECTVFIAMKDSTVNGKTIVLKNSDKVGSEKLVGPNFYMNKELNIVVMEKPDNGYRFVAVAAAGEVSIKMGINERGVVAGSNIARTIELRQKKIDITQVRALDRGWLLREGITRGGDASAASGLVLSKLLEKPMSTPGNIEFVDSAVAQLIEGSYDKIAIQKITSGVAARSNRFVLLEELNDPEDLSSYARYIRATQLLYKNRGRINAEMMIEFSQDHENGPGLNSICRHSTDFRDETSLAAAVMEINEENPTRSVIYICLGKPCYAWRSKDGNVTLRIDSSVDEIPAGFKDGEVFKRYYTELPVSIGSQPQELSA